MIARVWPLGRAVWQRPTLAAPRVGQPAPPGPLFPVALPESDTDRLGSDLYGFTLTQANAQAC